MTCHRAGSGQPKAVRQSIIVDVCVAVACALVEVDCLEAVGEVAIVGGETKRGGAEIELVLPQ